MFRGRNPYECFKSDRHRLLALLSRDLRLVLLGAISAAAGVAGISPAARAFIAGLFA
jgi:hypothetical protein